MSVVAIGFFDGVHLGHQKILKGADTAVTFRNHPLTVLCPEKAPQLIMSPDDRIAAIKTCGVRNVIALDFNPELAALSPVEFLSFLRLRLSTSTPPLIRCGANWRFGKGGEGTPDWLRIHGLDVRVIEAVEYEGEIVSSTRIRECLLRGEIAAANAMLGRRFRVTGTREKGKGEGKKLGFPTVNLRLSNQFSVFNFQCPVISLPLGVYEVEVAGVKAIANYGLAPTFEDRAWKEAVLEIHFVRGRDAASPVVCPPLKNSVAVDFIRFIRPERKFGSVEELKAQIAADIAGLV